jgi:hypothetical protein
VSLKIGILLGDDIGLEVVPEEVAAGDPDIAAVLAQTWALTHRHD